MKTTRLTSAILLAAAAILPSCDSDQDVHDPVVYNIVELTERDASGTTFHYYPAPGNTPTVLRAATRSATETNPGECLFLGYSENATDKASAETPITVRSVARILNTEARLATPDEIAGWDAEPINLLALWRAGEKIILRCLRTADDTPRHFGLLIDSSTLGEPVPTAYIYHRREDPRPNYSSQYYTAFSLAPLLHPADPSAETAPAADPRAAYTALRVRVANSANPALDEITIPL